MVDWCLDREKGQFRAFFGLLQLQWELVSMDVCILVTKCVAADCGDY